MADHRSKEKPPQIERAIEAIQPEGLDVAAAIGQRLCGVFDNYTRFRSSYTEGVALEGFYAQAPQFSLTKFTPRHWSGKPVPTARTLHPAANLTPSPPTTSPT